MAKSKITLFQEFAKGLWNENPILRMVLGTCPTLAVTTSAINGVSMGLAVIFTLVMSSLMISLLRKVIPNEVRIASFFVVIATLWTVADRVIAAYILRSARRWDPLFADRCQLYRYGAKGSLRIRKSSAVRWSMLSV
jgi:electron transport complex protein RnfE